VPFLLDKFVLFSLILCRVSGLVMSAPVFGNRDIPMQFRAILSLALALLLLPAQWHLNVAVPRTLVQYLLLAFSEVLVGLCLGLAVDILLSGAKIAGQIIGMTSGESMAELYDPQADESFAVLSQFFFTLTLLVFVCIGGHRLVLGALMETFHAIPPGKAGSVSPSLIDTLQVLLAQSFTLGIRAAAPTLVALVLATLVLGLISRTLPQINAMAMGFGLNSLIMYGMLMLSLGAVVMVFQDQLEPTLESLLASLGDSQTPTP
jgi:flagellar biosynthetic protein FliR